MNTRGIRLKSLGDVRRFTAKVVNMLHKNEIDESKARAFGYLASILSSVIRDGDIEERLSKLENIMKEKQK